QLENTGIQHPASFYLGNFVGMIEYFETHYPDYKCLRIYVAAYSDEGSKMVPIHEGNKLTLIFAPADEKVDLDYFNISPVESFTEANIGKFKVNAYQDQWRKDYVNDVMPYLLRTIDQDDPQNQIDGEPSDTRCITYCRENLDTFLHESQLIQADENNLKAIKFSKDVVAEFSAFGASGNPRDHNKYAKRLFVQLQLVNDHGRVVD